MQVSKTIIAVVEYHVGTLGDLMSEEDVKVVEERYNPLIGRKEIKLVIAHVGESTPRRYELRQRVAKMYNTPLECVYVIKITTKYGQGLSVARVHVYDNPKRAEEIEEEHIKRRNMPPKEGGE